MKPVNGFTLVELLVAMTVAAFLLASLSWVVATLGRETRTMKQATASQDIDAATPVLTSLFANALQDDVHEVAVTGSGVRLTTLAPSGTGGGVADIELSVRTAGGKSDLVTERRDSSGFRTSLSSRPMIKDAQRIRFEALKDEKAAGSRIAAVAITLGFEGNAERRLVFPIHGDSDGMCVFDPISMSCRSR